MVESSRMGEEEGVNGSGKEMVAVTTATTATSCENPFTVRKVPPQPPLNYYAYPKPLARYQEVAANSKVFMQTLKELHAAMGTKFMIPIIGGKELDLHQLFLEVTSRGGIEKVIRERRWKEVTAVFSFPSTATNASFVLRKYYVSLIHHYEQIYFFGAQGWSPLSADPCLQSPSSIPIPSPAPEMQAAYGQKRSRSTADMLSRVSSSLECPVVGIIDGKFEHGYLVTVTVGTEKLRGVLYHTPEHSTGQVPQYSDTISNYSNKDTSTSVVRRRRRRKKSEMKKRDPDHPKPNRSGYNFFFAEQHARLKPLHPGKDREISKMIGELWNNITETDKAVYQEKGLKDKERYRSEMEEYRERLRTSQVISNAVPIQQCFVGPEVEMAETDSKMDVDEDDSIESTQEHDSSSDESESNKEITTRAEKDMEMETSVDAAAGNVAESSQNATSRPPDLTTTEVDHDFESQKSDTKIGVDQCDVVHQQGSSLENESESIKKEYVVPDFLECFYLHPRYYQGPTSHCNSGPVRIDDDCDIFNRRGAVFGADGTLFEGGVFFVSVYVPEDCPFKPLSIKFETKIFHPNIDKFGNIDLNIVKEQCR